MIHRLLLASAAVIALLLVMSALGSQPAARADSSSMDWDTAMTDAPPTGSDADGVVNDGCPRAGRTAETGAQCTNAIDDGEETPPDGVVNDGCPQVGSTAETGAQCTNATDDDNNCPSDTDNNIDAGECPAQTFTFVQDLSPAKPSNESFFDMATQIWKTGAAGSDVDNDTLAEPADGIEQIAHLCPNGANPCLTLGTTTVEGSFSIRTNLILANAGANNIDDTGAGDKDTTLTGQSAVCGLGANTFDANNISFYLWQSVTTNLNDGGNGFLVPVVDTNGDGIPQANQDYFSRGQDCMSSYNAGPPNQIPDGIPDGVDCTPNVLPTVQGALGLPMVNYVARAYGVSMIPIAPPVLYERSDINFLVYNMVSVTGVQGYMSFNIVNYPGLPADDPTEGGYSPTAQTVGTCPPFTVAVKVYGIGQDSDFSMPPNGTTDLVTPREVNRKVVVGSAATYANNIYKSPGEDWDGDGIANHYDRCRIDPASGTAAQDTDKDGLTGLCDTVGVGAGNGEGNNPQQGGSWNTA